MNEAEFDFRFVGGIFLFSGFFTGAAWIVAACLIHLQMWGWMNRFGAPLIHASLILPAMAVIAYLIRSSVKLKRRDDKQAEQEFFRQWMTYCTVPLALVLLLVCMDVEILERSAWYPYPPIFLGFLTALYGRWLTTQA